MNKRNDEISPIKAIMIAILIVLVFITVTGYLGLQKIKNREMANEVTKSHTKEAYEAALYFLKQKLSENDEIYETSLEITSWESDPIYQHIYEVKLSGNYILDDFEDRLGRSRVRDDWKVEVEYVGPEDGKWDIKEKRYNWELHYVNKDLE